MIRFGLIALFLYFPLVSKAQTLVRIIPGKQTGIITFRSEIPLDPAATNVWMKFCKRLGRELSYPGPGFLSSTSCQAFDSDKASFSGNWHIELIEQKASFAVKLHFLPGSQSQHILSLSFPLKGPVLEHLTHDVLPVALARMLVEKSPSGWMYKHSKGGPSLRTRGELLPFPQNLLIYSLSFDKKEGLWLPRLYARLAKAKDRETGEVKERVHYEVDESYRPLQIGKGYWARGLEHDERQGTYQVMISSILQGKSALPRSQKGQGGKNFVDDYVLGSLRSSYAGFRYGKSIAKSAFIVNEVDMVSILAEIGGGPLAGLRGYYDLFPEVTRGSGSDKEYFELRRMSLGWTFNFEMPAFISPLFNTFNIQPKIGLLALKSHFYTTTLDGKAGLDFSAKSIYDLALETGVEKSLSWFRSRLWVAMSSANLGVSNKAAVTVKSVRGGMDLYFDLYEAGQWDVNFLSFASLEQLSLEKDPGSLAFDSPELSSVSNTLIFAGLGFTLSW